MKFFSIFILIILIFFISLSSCSKKVDNSNVSTSNLPNDFIVKEKREVAHNFGLSTIDGGYLTLNEFKGKVVLLDFWAEWCGPCKKSTPIIVSLYNKYKDRGFVVIGMNLDDESDFDKVIDYIKKSKIEYPITIKGFNIAQKYGVSGIPKFFLIDKEGKIALTITGLSTTLENDLKNSIEFLLKE
ncbi:MAG: TlpA family protein disulfide reductase [Caldisericia bacterium]|nr:TlpA family protein disulfide reductase [Caldisericia bacterium]